MHIGAPAPVMSPPVQGRVVVTESGADLAGNHHVGPSVPNQRDAYDLLGIDEAGRVFRTDGARASDYVDWGMPVDG